MMNRSALIGVPVVVATLVGVWPAISASSPQAVAPAASPALSHVVILATGGTIAGVQPKEGGPGYKAGSLAIGEVIKGIPEIEKLARLDAEQVANIASQDMNDLVWAKLARRANELLARPDVDGIVVTHGTDTMEETAFLLDLVLRSDKPVVLVGSMRPATSLSADGPLNLYNAVAVAADPRSRGRGVMVVANDKIHAGRDVRKTHTTAVQTFVSATGGAMGEVHYGEVRYAYVPGFKHTTASAFSGPPTPAVMPRVDIVYAHEGADSTMVKAAVAAGAKGIVLAGVGDGNASSDMITALVEAAKAGIVVVRASRVGSGAVLRNIELNDDDLGFVAGMDLIPQKARVLLRLALTKTTDPEKIQRYFDEY